MWSINMADVPRGPSGKPLGAKWKTPAQIEALEGKVNVTDVNEEDAARGFAKPCLQKSLAP